MLQKSCSECACRVCRRGCRSVFYAQMRVGEVSKTARCAYCVCNAIDGGVHREICPCLVLVALRTLSVSKARFAEPMVLCEIVACIVCATGTSPRDAHRATNVKRKSYFKPKFQFHFNLSCSTWPYFVNDCYI